MKVLKRVTKIMMSVSMLVMLLTTTCLAQSTSYNFVMYFNSGDEEKSDCATKRALRDSDEIMYDDSYQYASVGVKSASNVAKNVKIKVQKTDITGRASNGTATATKLMSSSKSYKLNYKEAYKYESGYYRLYAWATKKDAKMNENWAPEKYKLGKI